MASGCIAAAVVLVTNRLFDICSSISSLRHAIELDPLALNSTPSYSSLVQFWLAESGAARSIALFPAAAGVAAVGKSSIWKIHGANERKRTESLYYSLVDSEWWWSSCCSSSFLLLSSLLSTVHRMDPANGVPQGTALMHSGASLLHEAYFEYMLKN